MPDKGGQPAAGQSPFRIGGAGNLLMRGPGQDVNFGQPWQNWQQGTAMDLGNGARIGQAGNLRYNGVNYGRPWENVGPSGGAPITPTIGGAGNLRIPGIGSVGQPWQNWQPGQGGFQVAPGVRIGNAGNLRIAGQGSVGQPWAPQNAGKGGQPA